MTSGLDSLAVRNYADLAGLARLRVAANRQEAGATSEAARQFEALFIQMMLKSMRATAGDGGLFDGAHTRLYQDMFDQQISMDIARGRGMGLAPMIVKQLGMHADATRAFDGVSQNTEGKAVCDIQRSDTSNITTTAGPSPNAQRWDKPADFVQAVWPHAARAARHLGVAPEVLVAQAALETGWGERVPVDAHGQSSLNLFGIKADAGWSGTRVHLPTLEFEGGLPTRRLAAFRAYESIAASFDDYAAFITNNPRYGEALRQAGSAEGYVRELQAAGYATDPQYADKVLRVMRGIQPAASSLKTGTQPPLS